MTANPTPEDDGALAKGLCRRDPSAIHSLYQRSAAPLFSFALRFLRSDEDAEDVLQETWAAALAAAPSFRGDSAVLTWLFGIARRKCLERLRAGRRTVAGMEPPPDPPAPPSALSDPEQALDRKLSAERLEAALDALPVELREAILLRDVEGLPYEEVAAALGVPLGTMKSRLARARWVLRATLGAT